jgi:2-hydroxychromene-2-carboxylate isomerase
MRVAALACARGRGAAALFAMSSLAFGSGVDLERLGERGQSVPAADVSIDVSSIAEAAGLDPSEIDRACRGDSQWEGLVQSTAARLAAAGIDRAPALRWRGVLYIGSRAISPLLARESPSLQQALWDLE